VCNSSLARLARCVPSISQPHLHTIKLDMSISIWPGGRLARAAGCLLPAQGSGYCSHAMKSALNLAAAPASLAFDCRVARGVGGLGLALGS
jgi:hypothetical protein